MSCRKKTFGTTTAVMAAGNMGSDCSTRGDAVRLHGYSPDVTITFD